MTYVFFASALSVTVETTPTTAIVTFRHASPSGIVRYEASVYLQSRIKCSVAASATPLQCTLKGTKRLLRCTWGPRLAMRLIVNHPF